MQDLRRWTAATWFLLPELETALPGVIVGASCSGKTERSEVHVAQERAAPA